MPQRFYVTTPIYYINDVPHLGSAYTTIAADVLARYHRLRGAEVQFLTGTDEHGLKIQREAEKRGQLPADLADTMSARFREAWPKLGCEPADFIRTSEARHAKGVQELWRRIRDAGDIYLGRYQGLYCVGCEGYYTEKELNQPGNLCPVHGTPAEAVQEESYFFRLSRYGERLLAFYDRHPEFVTPVSRMNEVRSFVRGGLEDLSVSRTTFKWGIPVPDDPAHVMYVWFDALSNYWTALREPEDRSRFWPPSVHLVGKDILRFHAIYWPAFLMAAGFGDDELPRKVLAHGFLTYGGRKMSKSLRNTVSPIELAEALSPTVGVDTLRYCLLRAISFGQDGDFSIEDVLQRYASDLGNTLGNLLNRLLPFVPERFEPAPPGPLEEQLRDAVRLAARSSADAFDACSPTRALEAIWTGLAAANHYVDQAAPWVARKKEPERLPVIVTALAEVLDAVSILVAPVMPRVAATMRLQLGVDELVPAVERDQWPLELPERAEGTPFVPGTPIFPRLVPEQQQALIVKFSAPDTSAGAHPASTGATGTGPAQATAKSEGSPAEPKPAEPAEPTARPECTYDDFSKIELRIGVVKAAERVPKKDRLLRLQVDVGDPEPRTLVAGIAQSYAPEQLLGRRIVVLCNLQPRKFAKGLVSQGMLLAATAEDGVRLLGVEGDLAPGAPIR